ncbi:MAG: hypothetical protein ACRDL4_21735, partial [Thermoleophilaceae bacterium]
GQVALGPVISVMGLQRGATEARPHPRTEQAPEEEGGDPRDPEDPAHPDGGASPPHPEGGASPPHPEGGASP